MYARTGLVQSIDCLIREVTVADISFRQLYTSIQRLVRIDHIVMFFITGLDIFQNLQCLFCCCRVDNHFLETTFQSTVFLDVFTIFIQRRSTDTLYFTTCQRRFQHIGSVHRTGSRSCSDNGMYFIDKQDDVRIL